jgi:hypothetical protein
MSITRTYRSGAQVATFAVARQSLRLSRVSGYFNSNSNPNTPVWLQFFTTTVANDGTVNTPTVSQVPLASFLMIADYEFAELFNSGLELIPGPVCCALSTTEATYTAVASGQVADLYIEVEEWEIEPSTLTTVGPTTGNTITVWTDTLAAPSAAKALYDVLACDLNANAGAQLYLLLFAAPQASNTTTQAQRSWAIPAYNAAGVNINCEGCLYLNFGDAERGGLTPLQQGGTIGNGNTGINTSACYFYVSLTPVTYTAPAANSAKLTARFCTPTV